MSYAQSASEGRATNLQDNAVSDPSVGRIAHGQLRRNCQSLALYGQDVPDVLGDQSAGVYSLSVRLGPKRVFSIAPCPIKHAEFPATEPPAHSADFCCGRLHV